MQPRLTLGILKEKLDEKYFSTNWINQFLTDGSATEEVQPLLINTLCKASNDICEFFTLFLLSGEYCYMDVEKWETASQAFKAYLEVKPLDFDLLIARHESVAYEAQDYFLINILKAFEEVINPSLSYLFKDLESQFSLETIGTNLRLERVNMYSQYDPQIKEYMGLFRKTIHITNIEHFKYSFSEKILRDLIICRKEIDDYTIDHFNKKALRCKIDFLMKKFAFRSGRQSKKEEFSYSFDHNEDNILSIDTLILEEALKEWEQIIRVHYGFTRDYKNDQRKRAQQYEQQGQAIDYHYFHACMKIYKDDSRSVMQVGNLLAEFQQFGHRQQLSLDKFAKVITSNYLFNNEMSLKIEEEDISRKNFNENFKSFGLSIKNFQNRTFVRNYFPWQKLCDVLSKKLDELSNDLLDEQKFALFESLKELYVNSLKDFEEAFEWSRRKNLIPFQLSFDECKSNFDLISVDYGTFKLFFFSSYVLPVDYDFEKKTLLTLLQKKTKFETLSTTYNKLKVVVNEMNDIADRFRNSERRSIEILAIFSAISLFSVGSIQILTNDVVGQDPSLFYKIVLSFGYCLILFVIVIWLVTRNNIKKVHWIHWVLIITLLASSVYVITCIMHPDLILTND